MKKMPFSMHVDVDKLLPATDAEKEYLVQMRPSTTFFRDGVKRLLRNKVATVSFFVVVIIALVSIFLPMFWAVLIRCYARKCSRSANGFIV